MHDETVQPIQILQTLGDRLRFARTEARLSQQDVADLLGTSRPTVTQYELGTSRPDQAKLPILCKILSTNLDWLMTGEGARPSWQPRDQSEAPLHGFSIHGNTVHMPVPQFIELLRRLK